MNITFVDHETLAETLLESHILWRFDRFADVVHVAEREGIDILIIELPFSSGGIIVEPDSDGGSIHDHARWSN